ncbi:AAA domain [Trypanosoma vivax]|uniref:Putative adenylate kinase n=1 Tax=Trypanosoma vivax (strain Y486) TaxID=1055687 RepID=G0TS58_TRYVY|nr:putative adenylate kinase [Trypanosoma vivax]KAH8612416.1 AAA domain [Trypanosoma vivax]KAH8616415.1 AAA domain [Trypanosoma vivax]KAH8616533.1 AAA domain [Trypanosoma vivax]CCC46782.1 putative adenylate kinase, fragment [Trypanosoma vivax Y486]
MAKLTERALVYLKEHNVPLLLEHILRKIIEDTPERPMSYIADMMQRGIPLHVVIAGPPGSGKRTQCSSISKALGVVPINTGDLLRACVEERKGGGDIAKSYMDRGMPVPNMLASMLVTKRLAQDDALEHGWILEGFPRNTQQADAVETHGQVPQIFIVLELPERTGFNRLEHRRTDPATGAEYHLLYNPPPEADVALCERLAQSENDTHEAIEARQKSYSEWISAVKTHYAAMLEVVNADQRVENVTRDITAAIERRRFR